MTTTFLTIRAQQLALIEAIVPARQATKPFRRHRDRQPLEIWANADPQSALRRFDIVTALDIQARPTTDGEIVSWSHGLQVRVAYPKPNSELDASTLYDSDFGQIDKAIGLYGGANYVAGLERCEHQSVEIEDGDAAQILAITYLVQYDRSV